ncbi:MAG: hypothetical protein P8Y76_08635, partial [bacterium]
MNTRAATATNDTHSKLIGYLLWIFGFLGARQAQPQAVQTPAPGVAQPPGISLGVQRTVALSPPST